MNSPESIHSKGLERHMRELGVDYDLFVESIETDLRLYRRINVSRLAKLIGVSRHTTKKWVDIYIGSKEFGEAHE